MCEFQVGDPVRVRRSPHKTGIVAALDNGQILIDKGSPLEGSWWQPDDLELEPHVLDVDGNPIRAGQLVEACGKSTTPFTGARRVKEVIDTPGAPPSASLPNTGWWRASDLRVLTDNDLFVPPEPETKTVSLHATVTVPAWLHPDHYEGLLSEEGDSWADEVESVTVRVVSSTIHNEDES